MDHLGNQLSLITTLNDSGGLSSYSPTKITTFHNTYQFGVTRTINGNSSSSNNNSRTEKVPEQEIRKPDYTPKNWIRSDTGKSPAQSLAEADMLF